VDCLAIRRGVPAEDPASAVSLAHHANLLPLSPIRRCRLEQMARMAIGGLDHLYLYGSVDGSSAIELTPIAQQAPQVEDRSYSYVVASNRPGDNSYESTSLNKQQNRIAWYRDSIRVYQGNFTVDSDKSKLVDTMLSFWSYLLKHRDSADHRELFDLIEEHKEEVFPKEYFGDLIELLELLMEAEACLSDRSSRGNRASTMAAEGMEEVTQSKHTQVSGIYARWKRHRQANNEEKDTLRYAKERVRTLALAQNMARADAVGKFLNTMRSGLASTLPDLPAKTLGLKSGDVPEDLSREFGAARRIRNMISRVQSSSAARRSSAQRSPADRSLIFGARNASTPSPVEASISFSMSAPDTVSENERPLQRLRRGPPATIVEAASQDEEHFDSRDQAIQVRLSSHPSDGKSVEHLSAVAVEVVDAVDNDSSDCSGSMSVVARP